MPNFGQTLNWLFFTVTVSGQSRPQIFNGGSRYSVLRRGRAVALASTAILAAFPVVGAADLVSNSAVAQESPQSREVASEPSSQISPSGKSSSAGERKTPILQLQPADDVALPLQSVRPRTADATRELDALAWYGMGRLEEAQGNFRAAIAAYRTAIELNPRQVAIYRAIVPLAFNLNENEEGLKYALKLIEFDPRDVRLLQQLARVLITQGQLTQAADLLERGLKRGGVEKRSPEAVSLNRDLGVIYASQGKSEKAADAFEIVFAALRDPDGYGLGSRERAAIASDPETTFERFGQLFLDAKRSKVAIEAFKEAAKSRTGQPGILLYDLARVYAGDGRSEKAIEQLETYVEKKSTDRGRQPYDLLVKLLIELKREETIVPRLRDIADQDPSNAFIKLTLADRFRLANQRDEAQKLYQEALKKVQDAEGYLGLAAIWRDEHRTEPLLDALARAAVAGASDQDLDRELEATVADTNLIDKVFADFSALTSATPPRIDFATSYLLGKLAISAHRSADATQFYGLAMKIRPDRVANLADELAQGLLADDQYQIAVKELRTALNRPGIDDAGRVSLLFRLTQALEMDGQTDQALIVLNQAMRIAPDVPLLMFQRGWIYLHAKQWDSAEQALLSVIEKFPDEPAVVKQSRMSLSALYVEQGDKAKGMSILEEVYRENPEDPSVNNDLGYLYAEQGLKLEQAESMIRIALEAEPENPAYLDSIGWVLHQRGKYGEAATYLEQAVASEEGQDATLYDHLAECYLKLDQRDQARKAWHKAIELSKPNERGPGRAAIEAKLANLEEK